VMDGHEATRRIKAESQGKSLIIALTASAFEEDRGKVLTEGCDDFVRKPFRPADITETLRKHAGIRFAYADQPIMLPFGTGATFDEVRLDFTGVPRDWLVALRTATVQADRDRLAILLAEIRAAQPTLSAAVMQLAENFDFDAILLALDQAAAPRVE